MQENKKNIAWECAECGYKLKSEYPPIKCPQCKENWQKFSGKPENDKSKKWRCTVCGYIHTGEAPPPMCVKCGAGYEDFVEVK